MLPELFKERMQRMLGEEYGAFLESFGGARCQALRLNALKKGTDGCSAVVRYGTKSGSKRDADSTCNAVGKKGKMSAGNVAEKSGTEPAGNTRKECGSSQENICTDFAHLTKVPWVEDGYYYQADDRPGKHPLHEAGVYYIQEPSAMAPAELLDVKPGERVLDLCAAPGGKSTQIAAKMQGKGVLVCNEIHPARAKILSENIERMGICNAIVTNEAPGRLTEFFPGYFDKILVDAPCSGEGMFRKNEEACGEWSLENVAICAERQDGILDDVAGMLRPGGKLVYSTCTFAPEEDEGSISRFLCRHVDFSILPIEKERLGLAGCDGAAEYLGYVESGAAGHTGGEMSVEMGRIEEEMSDETVCRVMFPDLGQTLRIWPHRVRGEGHFAALLQKAGRTVAHLAGNTKRPAKGASEKPDKELEAFFNFCYENIRFPVLPAKAENGDTIFSEIGKAVGMGAAVRTVRFGEHIYLVPAGAPSLDGLKVLRPGLHLGELKKNRFEPSHALALALSSEYAAHVWKLDSRDALVEGYLKGQTFPAEGEKGWYLVCVDGFSIGWGKLAGGIMKNHYPIGLRWKDFKES